MLQKIEQHRAISNIHYFEGYCIFMRTDHIIELRFDKGFNGDANDAKNMVSVFKQIKGPEKALLLVVYDEDNTFSKDAREYIASDEVSKVLKADALVIKGLALKIIGNGYLKINKPKRPTRLFNSVPEALDWLNKLK